jgi:hypothetical protein
MQCAIAFLLRAQLVILALAIEPLETVAISLLDPKRRVVLKRDISEGSELSSEEQLS